MEILGTVITIDFFDLISVGIAVLIFILILLHVLYSKLKILYIKKFNNKCKECKSSHTLVSDSLDKHKDYQITKYCFDCKHESIM